MKKYTLLLLMTFLLSACNQTSSSNPLSNMADALEKKDPELFLQQIDMSRYAKAQLDNMTNESEPLKALDAVGKMLGIGGMSDLIGAVSDAKNKEIKHFNRGVSTGELELMCKQSKKPNCPWVATSLNNAKMENISDTASVARVTTPTNISTWIALAKIGENWKVVGMSELKEIAINYAENKESVKPIPDANAPAPPPAPKAKEEKVVRF